MAAIALALCSSSLAGTGDFMAGLLSRRIPPLTILVRVFGIAILLYAAIVFATGAPAPPARYLALGFAAGIASGSALFLLYRALAIGPMSLVSPISTSAAVVPVVVGLVTGDKADAAVLAGIALTIAGAVLIASEPYAPGVRSDRAPIAIGLAAGAALLIGLNLVALHSAVQASPLWTAIAARAGGLTAVGCAFVVRGDAMRLRGSSVRGILVVALLNGAAMLALVEANALGSLSIVATLASLYPVPTVGLALVVLGESIHPLRLAGAAGVLAGVALLSFSQ
jgi:drug/metabolite transporter (DMT)-like permease